MSTLVQDFLENHSFAELNAKHGVKFRLSACGYKASMNYDQIESHNADKLAQQCRGLVLSPTGDYPFSRDETKVVGCTKVVARPFDRFFNLGQDEAAKIDFEHSRTRFYHKEDGTLIICYFDARKGEWHVGTRAVCEADLPVEGDAGGLTFRGLFLKALEKETGFTDLDVFAKQHLDTENTYMFELCTEMNRVVVDYRGFNLFLLGVRQTSTGVEYPLSDYVSLPIPKVREYQLSNMTDMVDFVSSQDPSAFEGVVARDSLFRRVKCKNAGYMALGRVKDSALRSPRGLMQLILMEKLDDVIPLLPEYAVARATTIQDDYRNAIHEYDTTYKLCMADANKESPIFNPESKTLIKQHQKSFAQAVQARGGWMAPMMEQYHGKIGGLHDYILRRRNVGGDWPNGFLDSVLEVITKK